MLPLQNDLQIILKNPDKNNTTDLVEFRLTVRNQLYLVHLKGVEASDFVKAMYRNNDSHKKTLERIYIDILNQYQKQRKIKLMRFKARKRKKLIKLGKCTRKRMKRP